MKQGSKPGSRKEGGKNRHTDSPFFIDTNILVYLLSGDAHKAGVAEQLLRQRGYVSVQVLNECANTLRRKSGMSWAEIRGALDVIRHFSTVLPLTTETHDLGLQLVEQHSVSFYDAMIAASAILAGCEILYSEDFQHGRELASGLKVQNPFVR